MSIDIYKDLNHELVLKVQELKIINRDLEKEVIALNAKCLDEHEKHLSEKIKFRSIISNLRTKIYDALEESFDVIENNREELQEELTSTFQRLSLSNRNRRSSSGVSVRSPLSSDCGRKSESSENNASNLWNIPAIEEVSAYKEANSYNEVSSYKENSNNEVSSYKENSNNEVSSYEENANNSDTEQETTNDHLSRRKALQTMRNFNETPTTAVTDVNSLSDQVSNSNEIIITVTGTEPSSTILKDAMEVLQESNKVHKDIRKQQSPCRTPNLRNSESLNNFVMKDISQNFLHSTPKGFENSETSICQNETIATRPRRKIANISYAEPAINTKLRNETEKKSSKKNKTKK